MRRPRSWVPVTVLRHVRTDWALAVIDAALITMAWLAALVLRFDTHVPDERWGGLWSFLPLALAVTLTCHVAAGLYSGVWRCASIHEARLVLIAQTASMFVLAPIVLLLDRPVGGSVLVMATVLACAMVGAVRFQSRLFAVRRRQSQSGAELIVIGAGMAGMALARDIKQQAESARLVAFVDDDPHLLDRRLQGARVLGAVEDLPAVARRTRATHAVLAIPSAAPAQVRRIAALADEADLVLRVVPRISQLVDGRVQLRDVRDLEISDLLERDQIEAELDDVIALVRGRRVLVTGAGGSIGSEIARQVTRLGAARVALVDHDETHLFDVAADLPTAVQRLTDIREPAAVERLFTVECPDIVFHAAAHKHVPLLEQHPVEAVQTNVLGTSLVVQAAERVGVERFVFVSTDKAVRPSSVMGASKLVGESVVLGESRSMTTCAVRFGNVLGSRGSVVPTFVRQIRAGGPVTITDARMTRYFMSIPEAVRLVLHAAALARGREVFMLDMGEPVQILDLARRMIRLSGNQPGLDVEIRVTGMRPGEKLAEQLHTEQERQHPTTHPSIVRLDPVPIPDRRLHVAVAGLDAAVRERDDARARRTLMELAGAQLDPAVPHQRATTAATPLEAAAPWI